MPELPCGLTVNLAAGDCCKTACPHLERRGCDTRQTANPIEVCHAALTWLRERGASLEERRRAAETPGAVDHLWPQARSWQQMRRRRDLGSDAG